MAIDPKQKLRDCPEDQVTVAVPSPLNTRLDGLVELANEAGENTIRKELVAALILEAEESGETLSEIVRGYRVAVARDAVVEGQDEARFLKPERQPPGPRTRKKIGE